MSVPMLTVNCLTEIDERAFPYLGNVPSVRINPETVDRLPEVADCIMDEVFKDFLWRCRVEDLYRRFPETTFLARAPELISLASRPPASVGTGWDIVYPGPPLSTEELDLFADVASDVRVLSLTEWLARRESMTVQETQRPRTIGISISDSPDIRALGLSAGHLRDAMTDVATHLLSSGDDLAYGGDLREGGFTQVLFELAARYTKAPGVFISYRHENEDVADQLRRVVNYFAWPVHIRMTNDQLESLVEEVGEVAEVALLDLEGEPMSMEYRKSIPSREPDEVTWSSGLTAMRQTMQGQTDARILLGGGTEAYMGRMPGVAEEALLSLQSVQPVFLLGGFGGCVRDVAETLGLVEPWPNYHSQWTGRTEFERFGPDSLNNGLSRDENRLLARTPYIDEALPLLLRGLRRL